ncbi:MetQ/NlpA family ABC transporter substrate-binding protein [Helicobacter typhlonius]|uniref:Lipoprotein n=2 Tax=Helicobacter typhlonius TaxID=76936 RepID=A0A099UFY0_9HELI|nr:MetQ/NlpA family ABC transporter substrate-binding protein [Helicobacter typhlonius]TLD78823.1 ABC transporter substrate-binding protein [Helicobacter typhlonius]CUU40819.1 Methionine ABC transporter substrate-binding protein [Helicobacter typhlonius]
MKKLAALLLVGLAFVGCGDGKKDGESTAQEQNVGQDSKVILKVGATPVPHAEILEVIKSDLEKEGIDLQIVQFTDYVTPNSALNDGSLDANFHQHKPFLDSLKSDRGYTLEPIANIHIEPIGLYASKFKNIDELPNGAVVAIPNDPSNGGRALLLLEAENLIKLADSANLQATELDIVENPKELKIKPVEAALLPRTLDDVDAAVINGNYALQAGLSSANALILEGAQSPYANILVVQSTRVNDENLQKLKKALQSQKVKDFIQQHYQGEIVPVF